MYEWLQEEISVIKTPRFHIVDGPLAEAQDAVLASSLVLPRSYRQFVIQFGNAKLYHQSKNDSYKIGVFAGPREATLGNGDRIYHIGFHDGATVYIKPLPDSAKGPVFEFEAGSEEKVADDFKEWLTKSCNQARKAYGKERWLEIIHGPKPFTPKEMEIVKARRQIRWNVVGIDSEGNHIFEVTNTGSHRLPVLTVGVRSKDRRLNGAILLKIGEIRPGQTATLHIDCYKNLIPVRDIEVFELPDPQPEDRERYAELKNNPASQP